MQQGGSILNNRLFTTQQTRLAAKALAFCLRTAQPQFSVNTNVSIGLHRREENSRYRYCSGSASELVTKVSNSDRHNWLIPLTKNQGF
ncbi:hypothetical protein [Brasilonema sp. UFV-L1]|uniref:hypothetical protein n=1 Tax=Brasilonema sp. UFV-L1 TaxID=2234130 RepID=UPI00145E1949|nr:hypothetical protein [Brasilonema sp. UFV-L1]